MFPLLRKVQAKRITTRVEVGQEPFWSGAGLNGTGKRKGTRVTAVVPQARMPCSIPLTALRAVKPIASAKLNGRSSNFDVLTDLSIV